jgi:hypothetical protein
VLYFVNQSNINDFVQISVTQNSNSMPNSNSYLMYNTPVYSNNMVVISDIALGTNQGLFIYSLNGTTSFTFIGNTY